MPTPAIADVSDFLDGLSVFELMKAVFLVGFFGYKKSVACLLAGFNWVFVRLIEGVFELMKAVFF